MSRLTADQSQRLKPWAELYARLDERIYNMEPDDRKALYEAAEAASSTNCWYATYRVSQILKAALADYFGRETMREIKRADDAASKL